MRTLPIDSMKNTQTINSQKHPLLGKHPIKNIEIGKDAQITNSHFYNCVQAPISTNMTQPLKTQETETKTQAQTAQFKAEALRQAQRKSNYCKMPM
jgi:hypothetical protein